MGKGDSYRFAYDPVATMQNVPRLLGMELTAKGHQLEGGYYLNGDRHAYRNDKLKVFIGNGSIWISEEGGRCISLPQWLIEFGGASDFKEALRMIKGQPQAIEWNREFRERAAERVQYVSPDVLDAARQYSLEKCPLFRWMCRMFPEERVRDAWNLYNITTDSHCNAVYWYVNQEGKILYDKRIAYKEDGHRNKEFFPGRQYRVADGYSGKCYFGASVPDDGKKAFIVESEKSAVMGYLFYGRRFLATGGKANLREVDRRMLLLPDMDARKEWEERGEVWPWWERWPAGEVIPDHADVGDLIERRLCASGK